MQWVYRTVPLVSSLVVAAASFALSFVALRDVAAELEAVPASLAWLVPIVIDGGVMCASAVIWAAATAGKRRQAFPFFVVAVLVAISVVVNAAHAGPSPLAKLIAALPPLVLLATLELVAITTRSANAASAASAAIASEPSVAAVPVPTPVVAEVPPVPAAQPAPAPVRKPRAKRTTPATVAPQPAPVPSPVDVDAEIQALEASLEAEQISGHLDEPLVADTARRQVRVRALPPE